MFSFFTILRIIYSLIFTLLFIYFTKFISAIENKKKCALSEGWRITNGKVLSSLLMIVGIVNIFVPANKFLSTLPIIGSSYILLFSLALFGDLFIIYRLSKNIDESDDSKCKIKGYDTIIDFFSTKSMADCIYYTIIATIIFFYL
jgi:hypothetical protein